MLKTLSLLVAIAMLPAVLAGQGGGLPPADIYKRPLADSWPTYCGDYSCQRYSSLKQIDQSNVKNLTLAWISPRLVGSATGGGVPTTVGGEGTGEFATSDNVNLTGTVLMVDGTLYMSGQDNAWAMDARTGRVLWHYYWKTRGGTHIANRGMGMWNNYLFFETPDDYLVSLDAKTGKERWHVEISDFEQQYFSTMAPVVIDNHVLVGTGNDIDAPGFLQSYDPETGKRQWIFYTVPMNPGDPGVDTWASLEAARHGGAQAWLPGAFDPETRLYIFGTGNPTPAYTVGRGEGDNLFTCSLIAVNVDTGKMAWYYQTSPHDMHDWDSAQTPVLIDTVIAGRTRKLVSTAARNGWFFTLDRVTGENMVTSKYGTAANWARGFNQMNAPKLDPEKVANPGGALVTGSTTNW
jgi:alcohol dehydrogenase (cytochrome c)